MARLNTAYISLASNLEKKQNIPKAISALKKKFRRIRFGPAYETPFEGSGKQENYWNLCAEIRTRKDIPELYIYFKLLQKFFGRNGKERGEVPLDIDFLLFNNETRPEYKIPYPGMEKEAYRMLTLAGLAPMLVLPQTHETVLRHLSMVSKARLKRMKRVLL